MSASTEYSNAQLLDLFSIFSANPDKLTMVVIALATSFASTGLPLITEAVTLKDRSRSGKIDKRKFTVVYFYVSGDIWCYVTCLSAKYIILYTGFSRK